MSSVDKPAQNKSLSEQEIEAMDVNTVSMVFVKQYYWILNHKTHLLHKFYGPDSTVVVSESMGKEADNLVVCAQTIKEIDTILHHMFRNVTVTLNEQLPQKSMEGSVMIMVTGRMAQEMWEEERCFTQVFLLARQDSGYYIRTDTLQVHSPAESSQMLKGLKGKTATHDAGEQEEEVTLVDQTVEENEEEMSTPPRMSEAVDNIQHDVPSYSLPEETVMEGGVPRPDPSAQLVEPEPPAPEPVFSPQPKAPPASRMLADSNNVSSGSGKENTTASTEKVSFREALLKGGGKRAGPKVMAEIGNAKLAAGMAVDPVKMVIDEVLAKGSGDARKDKKQGASGEVERRSGGANDGEARPQRPRQVRRPRTDREGVEDAQQLGGRRGEAGRGRGRGRGAGRNPRGGRGPTNQPGRGAVPRDEVGDKGGPGGRPVQSRRGPNKEERNARTIFVGSLPNGIESETVHAAFSKFGDIEGGMESISVRAGPNRSFAFVVFDSPEAAQRALDGNVKLNGYELAIKPYVPRERQGPNGRRGGPPGSRRETGPRDGSGKEGPNAVDLSG